MSYVVRTVQVPPGSPLYLFCADMCHRANNLYNSALYLERQVFTSVGKDATELKEHQREVLEKIKLNLDKMNETVTSPKEEPKYQMPSSEKPLLNYEFLRAYMQVTNNPDYISEGLLRNTANNVLREVATACFDYLKAIKAYSKNPGSFTSKPKLPDYLPKQGLHTISIPNDCCQFTTLDELRSSKVPNRKAASIGSQWKDLVSQAHQNKVVYFNGTTVCCDLGCIEKSYKISEVKIEPFHNIFFIRVHLNPDLKKHNAAERSAIKKREDAEKESLADLCKENPVRACCIDLGVENFAAIVNNVGVECILFKGGIIKAINQYYNKTKALLQSKQATENNAKNETVSEGAASKDATTEGPVSDEGGKKSYKEPFEGDSSAVSEMDHLCIRRENQIDYLFQKIADVIIRWCKKNDIHVIVIGRNKGWKKEANMGAVNNQKFVSIPFSKFIYDLRYRAEKEHIYLLEQEESYTSAASFLDQDPIPTYEEGDHAVYTFSGIRGPTVDAWGEKSNRKLMAKEAQGIEDCIVQVTGQ